MKITTLEELNIQGFPISICTSEEGDIFAHFDAPVPPANTQEAILSYLHAEGFLPDGAKATAKAETPPTETPKIVVVLDNGTKEVFALDRSEILLYDPNAREVTIALDGKLLSFSHVKTVETQP